MDGDVIAQVRKLDEQLVEAFAVRDADRLMSQYWNSPELFTVGEDGRVTEGWDAAREFQQQFFAAAESIDFTFGEWKYFGSHKGVLVASPFTLAVKFKDGKEAHSRGRYTNIRREIYGRWLIVFEHVSSDLAAPSE